jgi:hypothetical protein
MTARARLPNRRGSVTFGIELHGLKFTCTASQFEDGRLGEIFVTSHMASDGAIAASLALQYGCPAETLRKALCRDGGGKASGPLGAALDLLEEVGGHGIK